jgi:hypothetical protein
VFVATIYIVPFMVAAWLALLCERHKRWIGKLIDQVRNMTQPGAKPAKHDVAIRLDDLLLPPQPSASVAADEERLSG